jgi:hypothetical protein
MPITDNVDAKRFYKKKKKKKKKYRKNIYINK